MKGDNTRATFKKENHYSSVRWQQGRVHVDADWNEEMDILAHWDRTTRRDVIGLCGGPAGADADGVPLAGFLIDVNGFDGELHISPGRYYVNGLLVENEADVSVLQQPDLPPLPGNSLDDVLAPPSTEISEGTYHRWLNQYGGMKAEEAKRLKELEQENKRLKKLLAEAQLDKEILKEALEGNY